MNDTALPSMSTMVLLSLPAMDVSTSMMFTNNASAALSNDDPASSRGTRERCCLDFNSLSVYPSTLRANQGINEAMINNPPSSSPHTASHPSMFSFVTFINTLNTDLHAPVATRWSSANPPSYMTRIPLMSVPFLALINDAVVAAASAGSASTSARVAVYAFAELPFTGVRRPLSASHAMEFSTAPERLRCECNSPMGTGEDSGVIRSSSSSRSLPSPTSRAAPGVLGGVIVMPPSRLFTGDGDDAMSIGALALPFPRRAAPPAFTLVFSFAAGLCMNAPVLSASNSRRRRRRPSDELESSSLP
mmetsp:Transcript_7468/g.24808  ORF Transcript_7468/g.24808 Transcript_7468/m.24808 type:complete len:304 (+) Transcript_7468:434-1345(+)